MNRQLIANKTLGKQAGRIVRCSLLFEKYQNLVTRDRRDEFGNFSLVFDQVVGNRVEYQKVFPMGEALKSAHEFQASDILRTGLYQIFVSRNLRVNYAWLLSWENNDIRTIYSLTSGAMGASLIRSRQGRWMIVEGWREDHFRRGTNLGLGYLVTPSSGDTVGQVDRVLLWDGRQFVPKNPGPTKISHDR